MLHDHVMSRAGKAGDWSVDAADTATTDRRQSDRVPFPAEVILAWNHDSSFPVRYRVIDAGDGGYRIHSCMPLLEGTTGMVIRILPGRGAPLGQPVMVAWCKPTEEEQGYEVGLRLF